MYMDPNIYLFLSNFLYKSDGSLFEERLFLEDRWFEFVSYVRTATNQATHWRFLIRCTESGIRTNVYSLI